MTSQHWIEADEIDPNLYFYVQKNTPSLLLKPTGEKRERNNRIITEKNEKPKVEVRFATRTETLLFITVRSE